MFQLALLVLFLLVTSFYIINDAYALAIFLRPDSNLGPQWTGSATAIDESSRDDSDFVTSNDLQQNQNRRTEFSLSDGIDPVVDIDHVVRYTFRENGLSADSPRLEVRLKQGDTALITWVEPAPLPNTFTLSVREVPPSIINQIGNYNDLRLEFEAICTTTGGLCDNDPPRETVSVSWAELQYETYTTPRDHPPPTISGIGFYKITPQNQTANNIVKISNYSKYTDTTDPQNYGKYTKSGKYHKIGEAIPTFEALINKPVQVQVKLDGVFASTRIEHLSLISTNTKSDFKSPNFEIIADKGKKTIVIDPTKILKDAKSTYSLEDGSLWVNFDLVFQNPLKKSTIVLQAWDELRRPVYSHLSDAWEITDPLQNVIQIAEVPDRIKVAITKKTQPFGCVENKTCFMPPEITIRKGGSVVWKNEDSTLHTIISGTPTKGPDGRFNFALIPQHSFERVFPFTGNYSYYCSIHPWYVGSIVVSDSKENHTHQFVDFTVLLPRGGSVVNGQTVILKDRNTEVLLSGHLPNVVKPTQISIYIISPDRDVEKLSVKTTNEGYYSVQTKLAKKWQEGKFQIISKYKDEEIGNINFTIVDKPIKKQNK